MKNTQNLVKAALCLALCMLLPFITGQIPELGSMFLPMHIPVILAGYFCGKKWGIAVGAVAPILRSFLFGRPVMFPMAVCMMFELMVLGFVSGLLYEKLPARKASVYLSLVVAIILGRIMFSLASFVFMGPQKGFWFYMAGALTGGYPGLIIQLILIPILVMALKQHTVKAQ